MKNVPGSRLLPDNLFNVPQNIVVPMGKPEVLAAVNAFLDDVRGLGLPARRGGEGRRDRRRSRRRKAPAASTAVRAEV